MNVSRFIGGIALLLVLAGCFSGAGPGYWKQLAGPYWVHWVDTSDDTTIVWRLRNGASVSNGLPGPQVYAAGFDEAYIVAAVHPYAASDRKPDESATEFWYVGRIRDAKGRDVSTGSINGPLDRQQYDAEVTRLHLPEFSWLLRGT